MVLGVSAKSLGRDVEACHVGTGDQMGNTKGGIDRLRVPIQFPVRINPLLDLM